MVDFLETVKKESRIAVLKLLVDHEIKHASSKSERNFLDLISFNTKYSVLKNGSVDHL